MNHIKMPEGKTDVNILDPCAGEGEALKQIATALKIPPDRTYAIELDAGRAEKVRHNIPGAHVVGPASFHGIACPPCSFGLIYCNPPFDTELGGGQRDEEQFAHRATTLLAAGGILVMVCPFDVFFHRRRFISFIDSWYEQVEAYRFPDHCRPFNEIVIFGKRRPEALPDDMLWQHGALHRRGWGRSYDGCRVGELVALGEHQWENWRYGKPVNNYRMARLDTWEPPTGLYRPHRFAKSFYAPGELEAALAESPLNRLLTEVKPLPIKRPPLPLAKGHVALLLASGMLDGLVDDDDCEPHVVRGTASKKEYLAKIESTENPDTGAVTEKQIYSQRIVLSIRAVGVDGQIRTFAEEPPPDATAEDSGEGDEE